MNDFLQKANSFPMYAVAFVVIAVVMLMAAFFLFKAYREGLKIGMEKKKLHKVLTSSVVFSIVPSIGILMGVITLAGSLGIPLPWLRLSVIGALHYETMAADTAAKAAGVSLSADAMTGSAFVTIAIVMTVGIIWGGVFCIIALKKYQGKVNKVSQKDNRWGTLMFNAMFIGMICAFIGAGFATMRVTGSLTSLVVILVSALFMLLFTWLSKRPRLKWIESFSLSVSMIFGMASAVGYSWLEARLLAMFQ